MGSRAEGGARGALLAALRALPRQRRARALLAGAAAGNGARERILGRECLRGYLAELRGEADRFLETPLPALTFGLFALFDRSGDRLAFEAPYFERRRRLTALALSAWLWPEGGYAPGLADAAWAVCDEYAWALPAHLGGSCLEPGAPHRFHLDLFACETAFAFAEILALLDGALPPAVAERMRREAEERVLAPFLARRGPWAWEEMRNNWCAVCAGSVGAAALYLVDDDERLADILARALPTLDRFMESFPGDGACLEGLGYWTYGVGFFLSFSELLRQATGGRFDPSAKGSFSRVAAFQAKAYLNDRLAVSFADGEPDERYRIGLTAFVSRAFPGSGAPPEERAAGFLDDRNGRFCLCLRDLAWSVEGEGRGEAGRDAGASWFPEAQWLVCPARAGGGAAFAAKGGDNGEPHNHNDVGSFILALGPRQVLADLGRGEYTKEYFGEGRYRYFCCSSLGHSLPIVGGRGQLAGAERRATKVAFAEDGRGCSLSMDIAGAYGLACMPSLARRFEYDGEGRLSMSDEYAFEGSPGPVVERFVSALPSGSADYNASRKACVLAFDGRRAEIRCSDESAVPRISIETYRSHRGLSEEATVIEYAFEPGPGRFSVEFEFRVLAEPRP